MKKQLLTLLAFLSMAATISAQVTFTVHGGTNYGTKEGCDKAFDNDLSTKWWAPNGNSYVDIEASEAVRIMGFTFVTADDNETNGRIPIEWEFFGSNDDTAFDDALDTGDKWTMVENTLRESTIQKANYTAHYIAINAPSTGYKYFRLKFVIAGWQLSEIIPAYGPEFQPPYTALIGYGDTGESFYNIFDNNTGSKWCKGDWGDGDGTNSEGLWWVIFKTSSPIAVTGYTITTANDAEDRDPKDWTLYGSNADAQPSREDASWEVIDSKTGQDYTTERFTNVHFNVDNPTGTTYKWFKWEITKVRNDGNMTQLSEFKFDGLDYDGAEDKLIAYRSSGTWGDGAAENMFDGNPKTKFGGGFSTGGYGTYVTFGPASQQQISITGYSLQVGKEWVNYGRIPKSWTLYGGNDANTPESTWEVIHTVTDDRQMITNAEGENLNSVPCKRGYYHLDAPSKPYKYFKILFNEVQSGGDIQLAELVLYYPHDVTTNNMELREETTPVFNGMPFVKNLNIKRNITAEQWIGLCLPFDYDIPSGWDVRELKGVSGSGENAGMTFSTASSIEAGKPYIVKTTDAVSSIAVTDKTISPGTTDVKYGDVTMVGNIGQTSIPQGSFYINTSSQIKKLTAASATLKGFRAYFTVDSGSSVKGLTFDFDDDATAIEMVNGQSSMVNGPIYNLAGQRLNKVQKGINIVNGRKVLY